MSDFSKFSNAQLISQLQNHLNDSAESLYAASIIWMELRRRGVNLSKFKSGLSTLLPLIASGSVAPEAALALLGEPAKIRLLVGMPTNDQVDLLDSKLTIPVVDTSGKIKKVTKKFTDMTYEQAARAIKDGKVLSIDDQSKALSKKLVSTGGPRTHRTPALVIKADKRSKEIIIGQVRVKPVQLAEAMGLLGYKIVKKESLKVAA